MYYNPCPDCGANLDPGEVCECRKEKPHRRQPVRNFKKCVKIKSVSIIPQFTSKVKECNYGI